MTNFIVNTKETLGPMDLGAYITKLREKKGWSTRELGRRAKVNYETVRKIEVGETSNPGIGTLFDIAQALGIPIDHLILAYKGKDPESVQTAEDIEVYKEAALNFIKALPKEQFFDLLDRAPKDAIERRRGHLKKEKL